MEHFCKNCKNDGGNTCKFTGAAHITGIECPSFENKGKEVEMFKVGDPVRVVSGSKVGSEGTIVVDEIEEGKGFCRARINNVDWVCCVSDLELVEEVKNILESKDTNPKDALGIKKAPASTLPTGPMYEVALAMLEGARKYGRHNYRTLGVKASVYYDAALRHLTDWWEGEDIDEASGIHHLMKAAACLFIVRDSMLMENWIDDRPPQYPEKLDMPRLNKLSQEMITKYPQCVKPFCHKDPAIYTETPNANSSDVDHGAVILRDGGV